MKKNNFIFALLFLIGCTGPKFGVRNPHDQKESLHKLSSDIIPLAYDLTLWTTAKDNFSGQVAIELEVKKNTKNIFIHGQDLKILFADLVGESLFKGQVNQVNEGLLRIDFEKRVPKGKYQLQINYVGKYQEDLSGLYRVKEGNETYLFTQFEPIDARKMLPCFDEPKFKTPFTVKVVSPKGQKVIANSALKTTYNQGDQDVHIFEPTKPISTYLLALASGPFDIVEAEIEKNSLRQNPIKLTGVATKGKGKKLELALKETPKILEKLEEYFGISYPYDKLHIIAVPDFSAGAMENVGAITFRERYLLLDNQSPVDQVKGFYIVMAHELAHQWFGNLVTMPWWNDLWLNESFATWLSHQIVADLRPEFRTAEYLLSDAQVAMKQDSLKSARKIREPINSDHDIHNAFDGITYKKGGAVLNMLESYLSPKLFREAVSAHVNKFSFGTATASDFLKSLAKKSDSSLVKSAESFLNQNGFPEISMNYTCNPKGFIIKATQQRYLPEGSKPEDERLWRIPVCIAYGDAKATQKHCFMMSKKSKKQVVLSESCPSFIQPNYNGQGYYRFSLETVDWQNLIKESSRLSEGDRMSIADSLMGELYSGKLDYEFVLDSLQKMVDINSSTVTGYFMSVFKEADQYWMNDANRDGFHAMAKAAITPIYQKLKEKTELTPDERVLRKETANFLSSTLKDRDMRAELLPQGKTYLENLIKGKKTAKLDALNEDMLGTNLCVAMQENPGYLGKVSSKLKDITDTSVRHPLLYAMSKSQEGEDAKDVRSLVFSSLRKNEQMRLFYDHLENGKNQPATFNFLEKNFDKLKEVLSTSQLGNTPFMADGLCSREDAVRVEKFFSPFIESLQGGPRNLSEMVEKINLCAALKERQAQNLPKMVSAE